MVDTPVRYGGTVAFLIEGAACAAEECAAVLMEFQQLRDVKQLRGHVYHNELFPKRVGVFGKSRGALQVAGATMIYDRHVDHRLSYPASEVETAILRNRLEGKGLQGFDITRDDDPDKELRGMIHQAMTWGFEPATQAP